MSHAGELARGNFRARLPDTDSSEFGQLAQTLNETAGNLQETVAQLQHEHAELEKLERVRKDFVINVSHELRTPLASIQGYTETLIDGAHRAIRSTTCAFWASSVTMPSGWRG